MAHRLDGNSLEDALMKILQEWKNATARLAGVQELHFPLSAGGWRPW